MKVHHYVLVHGYDYQIIQGLFSSGIIKFLLQLCQTQNLSQSMSMEVR
jgi:hypothetical protein